MRGERGDRVGQAWQRLGLGGEIPQVGAGLPRRGARRAARGVGRGVGAAPGGARPQVARRLEEGRARSGDEAPESRRALARESACPGFGGRPRAREDRVLMALGFSLF